MCCRDSGGRGCLVQGFTPGVGHTRFVDDRDHVLHALWFIQVVEDVWSRVSLQVTGVDQTRW